MLTTTKLLTALFAAATASLFVQDPEPVTSPAEPAHSSANGSSRDPLPDSVRRGLAFLAAAQGPDGGYGQDGRDPRTGIALESEGRDVANTAMVALALLRSGTSPSEGPHAGQLLAATEFILRHVENAPAEGLAITDRQGTQIQRKLGRYIDTFLASMLLAELVGQMPETDLEQRVAAALEKCVGKIEQNQKGDGSWNEDGWAPILSTSMASRSLDAARAKGVDVDAEVLARAEDFSDNQFDGRKREFKVGDDDAGIELYKVASVMEQASRAPASEANQDLLGVAGKLIESESFQEGFGSMGGEEFISYMNISDSLRRTGGEKWQDWNRDIKQRLVKLQNNDGSWAGHHCITGRIACTSAAIMTLTSERVAARPQ